ncbi:MAG: alanine racemase [Armatimonadota bacterium]|nr:alanine racemase [Armatimonadota bacterium]
MSAFPRTWAEVDLDALRHNLGIIRGQLPPQVKMALVTKADAYGHGLVPITRVATQFGVDFVAVATVQEGIALREGEIETPILVLAPTLPMEAKLAVYYGLRNLVESFDAAKAISAAAVAQGIEAKIHLKIDTGMARFGVEADIAPEMAVNIAGLPGVVLEGVATHFSNSGREPEYTAWQMGRFETAIEEMNSRGVFPTIRHCANSGALVRFPSALMDLARIGILAYGISHVGDTGLDLKPVMAWKARVMALRTLPAGRKVSYNLTFETTRATTVATLGVGYGDGYHRALSNKGAVVLHGKIAPILGVVCMDQLMVDVTAIPEVNIGDEAGLIEKPIDAEYLAEIVQTTPHEITTRIMTRVPRKYLGL